MMSENMDRRTFIKAASLAGGNAMVAVYAPGQSRTAKGFPANFMWGAATAAHQIEGNNLNSDYWLMENVKPSLFSERSGDACDSYHRFEEDIQLIKSFGLNSYRFSIEWARIEPNRGRFSVAEMDYYKKVVETCRKYEIRPTITFHHNTSPIWFTASGGWTNPDSPKLFANYCNYAALALAAHLEMAFTINEPQVNEVVEWMPGVGKVLPMLRKAAEGMNAAAAKAVGSDQFRPLLFSPSETVTPNLIEAHHQAFAAIKAIRGGLPVGAPISTFDYQSLGPGDQAAKAKKAVLGAWIEAIKRSGDFVGVQNYGRIMVDESGPVKSAAAKENPYEEYAPSLGNTVKYMHEATGKPVVVSENGINTTDDAKRIEYIDNALAGLSEVINNGVPVLGYFHWSLLDNFEWIQGFGPKYGLVSIDRTTFVRSPKPSAMHLGAIARANAL